MKRITIHHHPDCTRCRRIARTHKVLDWLGRVWISTDIPATGPLVPGEIAVEDARTGETLQGVEAVRLIFRQIPAYWPLRLLLLIPWVARKVDADVRGCGGGRCALPPDADAVPVAGETASRT
jgi:hypothetical protein